MEPTDLSLNKNNNLQQPRPQQQPPRPRKSAFAPVMSAAAVMTPAALPPPLVGLEAFSYPTTNTHNIFTSEIASSPLLIHQSSSHLREAQRQNETSPEESKGKSLYLIKFTTCISCCFLHANFFIHLT
jgi:hypothetical protein